MPTLKDISNGEAASHGSTTNKNPKMPAKESQQIWEWNRLPVEVVSTCTHYLIEARTLSQPDLPAVCSWDGDLTYVELEDFSSRLAGYLAGQGIGPEVLVPLCFEKSKWTIVAMLAVLKTGGAFVPLEPTQPKHRLEYIIRQTGASLVLSSTELTPTCKEFIPVVFAVDADSLSKLGNGSVLSGAISPKTAAYVIFTSGSTGEPKGVIIEHVQLSSSSVKGGKAMGFESKPRVLQFASYIFDACILEIITTLIFGGCVCVPSDWERMNGIVDAMNKMQVTCAFFTPSLLSTLRFESLRTLDTVILGGESLPPALVEMWAAELRLILAYGPTECCVICFTFDTSRYVPERGDIGRAISGRAWIVESDDFNELARIGAVGELLIEGPTLARGYLNDSTMTEAAFIYNPRWMLEHDPQAPRRLYRTGDLVKYKQDGSISFVGRIDNQVKLRGQRLELGEVEYHLQKCIPAASGVVEVVAEVVVPAGERVSPTLAAFLRTNGAMDSLGHLKWDQGRVSMPVSSETEQQRLASLVAKIKAELLLVLPAHAVPSVYIPLLQLPISVSGKADRKRLRDMAATLSVAQLAGFCTTANISASLGDPPSTPIERQLQALWAKTLEISPAAISLDDDFFWLGGNSVLAVALVAAARTDGLLLTVETIFRHPKLSDMILLTLLATHVEKEFEVAPFAMLEHLDTANDLCDEASVQCKIGKELVEDIYPCSPMQRGLMALSIKNASAYVLRLVYSLPLSLDLDKCKAAWQTVATQNPILRTRFFENYSGELFQVVVKEPVQWQVVQNRSLDSYLADEERTGMQIGQSMSRFIVLEDSVSSQKTLVWRVHHSLIDGWSLSQVMACVEHAYFDRPVAPRPGFNTFIHHLSHKDAEASKTFWRSKLVDAPPPSFPQLPSPTYQSFGNASLRHQVVFSRQPQTNITTATIIKGAWSLLVGMYSSSADVITGVTLSGRTSQIPGIGHIMGPTIATVPFRTQFQGSQPVVDLLQKIQRQFIDTIPYEQLGLHDMKRISAEAEAACNFRCLLVIQSMIDSDLRQPTAQLLSMKQDYDLFLDYALTMQCEIYSKVIKLRAIFDDRVLNAVQVQRIFHQFEYILHQLCLEDPAKKVSDAMNISQADMNEVMEWNSNAPNAFDACIHDLIGQRTINQPTQPAICSWDGELSYKTLDELSSRLASHLASHESVGPECYVPICFEKSKWAVIAMLAVLKAGAACVPLDSKHPISRLRTIIEDLGQQCTNIILASASNAHLFDGIKPTVIVNATLLDDLPTNFRGITKRAGPKNPAFVVFTSGSTGRPKGIILEHTAVCTSAREHGKVIKLDTHSRVVQFAAYTFDVSYSDIFVTLMYGGCVCIPSEHDRMNNLTGAIQSMDVNQACLTATVASQLQPEDVKGLKTLVLSGEPMTRELVERWADHVTLINMYGPAECTIHCVGESNIRKDDHPSNIGHGVGALIWITNPNDSNLLTPIGGIGEILIEGPTLARGYLNDELQTKSAFIENPTWMMKKTSGDRFTRRLYKSGDLARYNWDGSISFVGRKDDGQVKLRGQRVELGEVEHQLKASLPTQVEVTVMVIVLQTQGEPALAAFLAMEENATETRKSESISNSPAQLENFRSLTFGIESKLSSVLPSYMVPAIFIPVSRIPLTTSGKINRRRLQEIAAGLSFEHVTALRNLKAKHTPPSTRMEQRLHDLWKMLLKIESIGIEDNFFQLGGDSVTAMRLVAAARKECLSLTVDKIFKNPVLSDMALMAYETLQKESTKIAPVSLLPVAEINVLYEEAISQCNITKDQIADIYPCTPQQEFWIRGGVETHEHQAQSVYSLPVSLDLSRFRAAWEAVAANHAILRTRIIRTSVGFLQVVTKDRVNWRKETSLKTYLENDRSEIIGLGDQLQRFCIVEDENLDGRYFVFTAQHSSYDGWSLYLLFEDLNYAYQHGISAASGAQFNMFIKTLAAYDKNAASSFWQSHLAGSVSKPLFLVPENHRICPDTQWKREIPLSRTQGSHITVSTMIEVAWAIVFSRTFEHKDVILDILRAGRTSPVPGIEELIAPTTTAVPLHIHVDPHKKVHELLFQVQQQLSEMTAFEHIGFYNIAALSAETYMACKHSIRVNIAPPLDEKQPGSGIDLPLVWAELALILPFRLDCDVKKNAVTVEAVFDKDVISQSRVDILLRQFEQALQQVALADREQRLGEVDLSGSSERESTFMESISAESRKVRQIMLVSCLADGNYLTSNYPAKLTWSLDPSVSTSH